MASQFMEDLADHIKMVLLANPDMSREDLISLIGAWSKKIGNTTFHAKGVVNVQGTIIITGYTVDNKFHILTNFFEIRLPPSKGAIIYLELEQPPINFNSTI